MEERVLQLNRGTEAQVRSSTVVCPLSRLCSPVSTDSEAAQAVEAASREEAVYAQVRSSAVCCPQLLFALSYSCVPVSTVSTPV